VRSSGDVGKLLNINVMGERPLALRERRKRSRLPQQRSRLPQQEAYTLKDVDQIKVLADPLRIRVLEAFCEERTTKQVAELLGEKPTKLYHHVDALEGVGLIALSRTRQKRGTVEKYYLAVARTFRADSRVFQPKQKAVSEKSAALRQMMSTVFDTTSAELASLIDQGEGEDARKAIEEEGIVSFLEIRGSEAQVKELRGKLHEIVESVIAEGNDDDPVQRRYRLMLAYYPLDSTTRGPRRKS
jgi:DNA-binding transcriptional ArsR family regulator